MTPKRRLRASIIETANGDIELRCGGEVLMVFSKAEIVLTPKLNKRRKPKVKKYSAKEQNKFYLADRSFDSFAKFKLPIKWGNASKKKRKAQQKTAP